MLKFIHHLHQLIYQNIGRGDGEAPKDKGNVKKSQTEVTVCSETEKKINLEFICSWDKSMPAVTSGCISLSNILI